jgi:DNA-binding GntR family transcriptional regulator
MWAKASSERGALIRLCGDGVVSNEARNGVIVFDTEINPFFCTQKQRTVVE